MDENNDLGFQLEQQTADPGDDEPAGAPSSPETLLTCSCPKCGADLEARFTDEEQPLTCPSCSSNFILVRESSATRARRRSRKLSCAVCGNLLDHRGHCGSCGTLFPDYHVAVTREELHQKARAQRRSDFRQSLARFNPSLYVDLFRRPALEQRQRRPAPVAASSASLVTPRLQRLLLALLGIALMGGGASYAFTAHKKQQLFAKSFTEAIYGMKTGTDFNLEICDRIATEWKAAQITGSAFAPSLKAEEKVRTDKIGAEVAKIMQNIGEPPKKYAPAHQKLTQLREAYKKSADLLASPPESLPAFTAAAERAKSGFSSASQDLKSDMPDNLREELERAKQKYHRLKDF